MIRCIGSLPLSWLRLALMVVALAVGIGMAAKKPMPVPAADSLDYLSYARSLYLAGTYARTPAGPQAETLPGREPLYPVVIVLAAHVSPAIARSLVGCSPPAKGCHQGFRGLLYLNGALLGLSTIFALLAMTALGGGRLAHLATAGYLVLNLHVTKDLAYVVSDFLAMALTALAAWLLVVATRKGWRLGPWLAVGAALAALALTKASFLPLATLMVAGLGVVGLWHCRRQGGRALLPALALAAVLLPVNGGWTWRNIAMFGTANDDRGAIALSTREVFNSMTRQEHLAAWVWWTRAFGDDLAKSWFAPSVWNRHEWYSDNGFYLQGQVVRYRQRVDAVKTEHPDWPTAKVVNAVTAIVAHDILTDWPGYVLTMPVLIYRGLWCDEFILLGFPLLVVISLGAARRRDWAVLAALGLCWWSILFYPAVSLNLPRYQMTALIGLALAAGLFVQSRLDKRTGSGPSGRV